MIRIALRTVCILALLLSGALPPAQASDPVTLHPAHAPGPLDNPLKGWCVYTDAGEIHQPYSMVFLYVPWKTLEPAPGEFAFDAWEQQAWSHPKARGKHIVLRVYIDYPDKPTGLPQWLIDQGVAMRPYTDYGGGQSPDYEHPLLAPAMEHLIEALGRRYNAHPQVAFIQLGLLGFWGEWHTYPRSELFASPAVRQRVLEAYRRAFPDKQLMVRYPDLAPGAWAMLGYHDDMFPEETDNGQDWSFLARMRRSGRAEAWHQAVIGGEMVPRAAKKWLGSEFEKTLETLHRSHFSWIGPYGPALEKAPDAAYTARSEQLVRRMGYQFRLTEVRHDPAPAAGATVRVSVKGVNEGVAPFYYPWPVELALLNPDDSVAGSLRTEVDIRRWLPGEFLFEAALPAPPNPGKYRLALGILDPWTGQPAIRFANRLTVSQGWTVLGEIQVTRP